MFATSIKRPSRATAALALAVLCALSAGPVFSGPAQAQPAAPRADPADAAASVPPLAPVSTLSTYRRLSDEALLPWKQANETVGRIGGWRSYAREAQATPPAASSDTPPAAPAAASAPASGAAGSRDPHAGHAP